MQLWLLKRLHGQPSGENRQSAVTFDPSEAAFCFNETGDGVAQRHLFVSEIGYTAARKN